MFYNVAIVTESSYNLTELSHLGIVVNKKGCAKICILTQPL